MSNPPLFAAAVLVLVTLIAALAALKNKYGDQVATALARAILASCCQKRTNAAAINSGAAPKKNARPTSKAEPDSVWSQSNLVL